MQKNHGIHGIGFYYLRFKSYNVIKAIQTIRLTMKKKINSKEPEPNPYTQTGRQTQDLRISTWVQLTKSLTQTVKYSNLIRLLQVTLYNEMLGIINVYNIKFDACQIAQ